MRSASWLLLVLLAGCTPTFLDTHPHGTYENHPDSDTRHTWQCVTKDRGTYLGSVQVPMRGNKYIVEQYDRDQNGQPDMVMIYGYVGNGGQLNPIPLRYVLREADGDYEFVDMVGDGRCSSIVAVIGNPDGAEPGSQPQMPNAQPRKQYPKEEVVPGQDGEEPSCHEDTPADPKEQA